MKAEELRRKFEGIVLGEDANGEPVGMTDVELDECMKFAEVYKEQQIKELVDERYAATSEFLDIFEIKEQQIKELKDKIKILKEYERGRK